uniref:Uncharacterized protein n=2 Tax=viral metagenome TaxID=1070528 RepID=A0A6M3XM39_9ZZZZ
MKRKRKLKTWKEIKMEMKEKNTTPKVEIKEEPKEKEVDKGAEIPKEKSESRETTVIHQTGEEAVIASMVKDFDEPLSKEELNKVLIELEPYEFTDPKKTILDEIKELHPNFKIGEVLGEKLYCYKYRFINMDKERLTEAFGTDHWKVVNRTNHPNVPKRLINDSYGAILFEGQMLCFRESEIDRRLDELDFARHMERVKAFEDKDKNDPRFYKTTTYTSGFDEKQLVQNEDSENRDFIESAVSEE